MKIIMKKNILYLLTFLLLTLTMLPELISTAVAENLNKKVICSVKLTKLDNDIISTLSNKSVKNLKYLILDDSYFIDPVNSQTVKALDFSGYKLSLSMNLSPKTPEYYRDLKETLDKYDVSMIYLEEKEKDFDKNTYEKVLELVMNKGINLGLLENSQQNGLQYSELLTNSSKLNGISDRTSFISQKDISGITVEDLKYRLLRSVVDRGIRYISVEAYDKNSLKFCNNVYGELGKGLTSKGYDLLDGSLVKISGSRVFKTILVLLFSAFQMITLFLALDLNKKHIKFYSAVFIILILSALCISFNYAMLLTAFSITITVPSSAAIYMYKRFSQKKSLIQILKYHFIFFLIYILSGCFIWLALSDFDFRIGFITYKMAVTSFILPFCIELYVILGHTGLSFEQIKKAFHSKKTIGITLLSILAVYIYLSRSGNYSIFPASALELKFRILLEDAIAARPRLKEFLIGYPCFFLFFMTDNEKKKVLPIYFLLGANIAGISILNTFCHSFTPVTVSVIRAFSGFILGTVTGALTYFSASLLLNHSKRGLVTAFLTAGIAKITRHIAKSGRI